MAADFFTPSATRDLDEAQGRVDTALSSATARSISPAASAEPAALDQNTLKSFEDTAVKYNVPVDVLMAMAEKDSNFDALARTRGPGPKMRGIISMSDDDVRNHGINPYMPDQSIDTAGKKLRGLMDNGLSVEDAVKAYASNSADPSQWGPQSAEYASDVLSRTKRIKDAYYPPEPAPAPAPAPDAAPAEGSLAGDAARQFGGGAVKGVGSIVHGAGEAAQEIRRQAGLPQYRSLGDALGDVLEKWGKGIEAGVSSETKKAIEDSSPGGSLFKPSTWTLGKNPSLRGYTALGLDLFGGMLPIIAGTAASGGSAAVGAAVGGLQGGGAAKEQARDAINKMADDGTIEKESAYYRQLIADGKTPAQALNLTRSAAERYAFIFTTPISALGGAATAKILHPASALAEGMGVGGRVAVRGAVGAAEEGTQETAEQMAQNVGVNAGAGTNIDPMEDTFGNFLLGAFGGGVAGAGAGSLPHGQQAPAPAQEAPQEQPPSDPSAMAPQPQQPGPAPQPAAPAPEPVAPAPAAPANEGPLSRVLNAGAPDHAALANIVGKRVVLTDKVGQMAGHVIGQDEDGVMFKGDDGAEQLISHDELTSGAAHIVEAPNAPTQEAPRAAPPDETGPSAESVAAAVSTKKPAKEGEDTGLADLGGAAEAISKNLYGGLFDALKDGKDTYAGVKDPVLARAKEAFSAGLIKTPEDLKRFEQEGYPTVEAPRAEEAVKPIVGKNYIAAEGDKPFKTKEEASKAIVDAGQNPDDYNIRPASVGEGFFAKKKIELRQPKAEEPAKAAESNLAEEAQAKTKFAPKQPERPLTDMSDAELRERMKFIAGQAKTNGGWNKMLSTARREVEREIDKRNTEKNVAGKTESKPSDGIRLQDGSNGRAADVDAGASDHKGGLPRGNAADKVAASVPAGPALAGGKDLVPATVGADAKPALTGAERPGKWFGTREKAEAHIAKKKIGDTHEIEQVGQHRFNVIEKAKPAEVAEGFEKFSEESGTLGIPRADMPQVPTESHGGLVRHLNAQGITHETKEVSTEDLKPTQAEFSPEKVAAAREAEGDRSIIVSNDGHVIDGHHQWLAAKENDEPVKAIVLDAPVHEALEAVKNSPSAQKAEEPAAPEPAKAEAAPERSGDYGANNKLVSRERAEELKKRLKQKLEAAGVKTMGDFLSDQKGSIDPELMSIGAELAAFHLEAGARKFGDFAKTMASELGVSVATLKPYLRSWYNGARDMMEDAGLDVSGMDGPDAVRSELARILSEDASNESGKLDRAGSGALEGVPAEQVQGTDEGREAGSRVEGGGRADVQRNDDAGKPGLQELRGVGNGQERVSVPAARAETKGEVGQGARGERGGADVQRVDANDQPGSPRRVSDPAAGRPAGETGADFAITDADAIGEGGAKTKFKNNLEAIRVLKRLEASGEKATAADQAVLAKYVGWGGLPQAFERSDKTFSKGWEKEGSALRELLTKEELDAAAASTRNAHYTSPEIVKGVWSIVRRLGFDRGRVLEPSVGVGNFFGLMPASLRAASALHGVELDSITGGIAKHLYPAAKIAAPMGFQNYKIPDGYFDAVIGNPPFGSEKLYDPDRKDLSSFSIHNYFFAKAMDGLKPGGVMAMVVTNRMLDAQSDAARRYLSDRADLVAAIRLPNNAFLKNAGTEVTTDIVVLRKRAEGEKPAGEPWDKVLVHKDKNGASVPLNEYFARHPENMLGEFGAYGSMYRPDDPALVAREGQDTGKLLKEAIDRLPKDIVTGSEVEPSRESIPVKVDVSNVRVGSMFIQDGKVLVRADDILGEPRAQAIEFPSDKAAERVGGMIGIRDHFADLRRLQLDDKADDARIEAARRRLNGVYDAFVAEHGFINSETNRRLFEDDPSWPNISALEDRYNKGVSAAVAKRTGQKATPPSATKAAVFTKRTQSPYHPPTSAATAKDALVATLSERGRIDLEMMERLYGKDGDAILKELGDLVFNDPVRGLVTQDEYLSGNVKQKLAEAIAKANTDRDFERNVTALKAVQPADVHAADIDMKIGSHWTPPDVMKDFVTFITGDRKGTAIYNPATAEWTIRGDASADAMTRWATDRTRVAEIVEAAANQRAIKVTDKQSDGSRVVNETATQAANDKVNALKDEWKRWVWEDDARRERLGRLYNDMFNTTVARQFDGPHLVFPGKVGDDIITLRPHQKNAVWRILQSPTTLTDHVVGAGKTFTLIAAAMEGRRMGLMKKPMFTVPNHLVGQWATDFAMLYPGAKILAATKRDFEAANRKRLFSRIATGDWDAVIVAHSSFGKVEVDPQAQAEFIERQVADYMASEEAMRAAEGKDGRNVKKIQARIAQLAEKQKRLLDTGAKDDNIYWKELGVDAIFLDEAHEFKNLEYSTSMQRVAGLGSKEGSQKASDMYLKVNQVLDATGGRNITFATGTPISNTMAEMFTMQRYLDGKTLAAQGLTHFDAWARMFGEVVTDWELSPAGKYKLNSRFAKFVNMPELMQRYQSFADVINRDDINAQLAAQGKKLPVPKVKGGKPQNIVVDRSKDQANYIGEPIKRDGVETDQYPSGSLVWRADNIPKKAEKGADNMLKIMSDARKAALDMRLIDPSYPDYAGSKVNVAAKNIKALYDKWNADKGTQLVFIDLSTPKAARGREAEALRDLIAKAEAGDEDAQTKLDNMSPDEISALDSKFSVYDDLREKLITLGIPAAEVEFIHSANTDQQKKDLFDKVRSGQIRVLFGSTAKMGAGMNVQDRLVGLHHLDAPWRPSDLEQREGRIIRQGNKLYERDPEGFEVEINRYAAKQTLDSRMWQTIESKANFIEQVRKGTAGVRSIEDIGGEASNAAEMKAAASGNPLILEEMALRNRIKKLSNEEYSHRQEQFRIRDMIRMNERANEDDARLVENMKADQQTPLPEDFAMNVRGETYDKRKEAGAAILAEAKEMANTGAERTLVGSFGGFKLTLHRTGNDTFYISAKGVGTYETTGFSAVADAQGVAQRIANTVRETRNFAAVEREIAGRAASIAKQKEQIGEWKNAGELIELKTRHGEVINQLKPKAKEQQPAADPKASLGEGAGTLTAESLKDHLVRGEDGPLIEKMIEAGKVRLHDNATTLPSGVATREGVIRGVTMPDGTIHLVAGNLTPEDARAVLLHEAFHAGAEPLIGSRGWRTLMERVGAAVTNAMERELSGEETARSKFWREVFKHVENVGIPTEHMTEEVAAYAIEAREQVPPGIREAIDSFIGQAKAWVLRRFGVQFREVTPGQLRALAAAALRSWRGGVNPTTPDDGGLRYSMASPERFKPVDEAKNLFDRASRLSKNFMTNMMAGTDGKSGPGEYSLLGMVPVRPLFLELAKGMPAAKHYIDTKQAMDAMRHHLNNEDAAILDKWSKWVRQTKLGKKGFEALNKAANRDLMDIMHESTLDQVDPSESFKAFWTGDDEKALKKAKTGSEEWERLSKAKSEDEARKAAWDDLSARFNALPDAAKEIYAEVRDAYTKRADATEAEVVANIRRALDTIIAKAQRAHADEMQRIDDEGLTGAERDEAVKAADLRLAMAETRVKRNRAARMKRLREQFESNRLKGPYFPLARFGKFNVTVRDADGKVISFSKFESAGEQKRFAEEMRQNPDYKVQEGLDENKGAREGQLDAKFVSEVDAILEGANAPEEVRDQIWQRYLETLPDLSMRKHRIHRKGRAGFNTDALRAFAHNMFHSAHQLARLRYGMELQEHMEEARRQVKEADDPVRAQAVYNEMKRAHDFAMNPSGSAVVHRLTSLAFLWTMGWNLSTGLVVLHDPVQRGIPNIAYDAKTGNVGVKRASAAVARAFKEVLIGKGSVENASTLAPEERKAMEAARDLGVIENTNAHDLAGVSEAGIDYSPWMHKLMTTASTPLHHAERVNREVTFLAAYRIARGAGLDHHEAIKNAADLTWMSQFDTQSSSKPRVMREGVGKVALALRNFHANILYRFFKDANEAMHGMEPEAKKASMGRLISSVAITAAMAGVRGAYFYKIIWPIAFAVMAGAGLADKDDDADEWLRKHVLNATGDTMIGRAVGGMMMDGLPGYLTGTNLSDRIGVADLGLRPPDREMNAEQRWQYWLEQLGGPALEVLHSAYKGAGEILEGNIQGGLEEMLPASFRNVSKAVRYAREGVRDKNGEPLLENVAPQDVAKQAAGFGPAEITDRRARNTFQKNAQERIHHEKSIALRGAARARMAGEGEDAAQDKVEHYNERFPEAAIKPKSIRSEIKRFRNKSGRMEFGVDLDEKLEDRIKDQTAPSIYSRE